MQIILLERVEKLGGIGDVVTVKDGYARNFLLPNKKALRSNAVNLKVFEANRAKIEADNADRRATAQGLAGDVDGKQIILIRQASNTGQLYGSVAVRDIVEALHADGVSHVNKAQVILERPIKTLGLFDVRINLHPEVAVTVQVNVARSPDEAELQKQGINVLAQEFEDDQAEADAAADEFLETQAEASAELEGDDTPAPAAADADADDDA